MDAINVTPRNPAGNDKIWAILCHVCGFLGVFGITIILPLVVYLSMRDESEYLAENSREALNFHISLIIYTLCAVVLTFVLIGFAILGALWIGSIILSIVAAIKASEGGSYRYPLTIRFVR